MNIAMYNTWFGDCFELNNSSQTLFVDFGIHRFIQPNSLCCYPHPLLLRDIVHENISTIIKMSRDADFLLTHYHEDHYSGLLYMYRNLAKFTSPVFNTVYIPDVWSLPNSALTISLILLEELLRTSKLSGGSSSPTLLELIKFLCKGVHKVVLTKRGTSIAFNNSIALWPDSAQISHSAQQHYEQLQNQPRFREALQELVSIAEDLRTTVLSLTNTNEQTNRETTYETLQVIDERLSAFAYRFQTTLEEDTSEEDLILLNNFGNKISIVFHNKESSNENYLFTGDIPCKQLDKIVTNYDGSYPLHQHYKYIKIPHHGTEAYYYDFSSFSPEIIMIPNGKCHDSRYQISANYCTSHSLTPRVYCSNSNWCASNPGKGLCSKICANREIVFPRTVVLIV